MNLPKRILSTLAGIVIFSGLTNISIASTTFSDVPSMHENSDAINYVRNQNIVEGYSDGTFRPDNLINRAEFIKIVIEANYQGQAVGQNCFPDVGTEWFAKYVCFGKSNNIIAGYPDGNFKPNNEISFAEIAKVLINVNGLTVKQDSNVWYKPYTDELAELHAIPTSIKRFDQKVTRGEMAEMVYRLSAKISDKPYLTYANIAETQASSAVPVRIKISAINVDAPIETIGLTKDGAVGIPSDPDNAAWFDGSPRPGKTGNSIITGHVNWYYGATGVFEKLNELEAGDIIEIQDDNGTTTSFIVRESKSYDDTAQATDVFISTDGRSHLNLITCEGIWNKITKSYSQRLVVFTDKI